MSIKDKELFHGAVLVKITHNERPVNLQLIETHDINSALYTINEAVHLFIKSSKSPKDRVRSEKAWLFTFEARLIELLREKTKYPLAFALVCGEEKISNEDDDEMFVCFINQIQLSKFFDLATSKDKGITVKYEIPKKKGRLVATCDGKHLPIKLSAIEKWDIPGR